MIQIEDSSFPLDNEFDCIIPFEIFILRNKVNINAYDIVKDIVSDYLRLFDDLLSDEAINYLYEKIDPVIYALGYAADLHEWLYHYEINCVNSDMILPNTIKWESSMDYHNLTSIDLDYIYERNMFVTLIDEKIVSYACENLFEIDDIRDIGVETAAKYTGNGFATSNAAALALYNLNLGNRVSYICEKSNYASQKIAEKIGFEKIGKEFHYVCYRR